MYFQLNFFQIIMIITEFVTFNLIKFQKDFLLANFLLKNHCQISFLNIHFCQIFFILPQWKVHHFINILFFLILLHYLGDFYFPLIFIHFLLMKPLQTIVFSLILIHLVLYPTKILLPHFKVIIYSLIH